METDPTDPAPGSAASLTSDSIQINVLVVIDTDFLKNYLKEKNIDRSKESPDNPTRMPSTREGQYMICTGSRAPATGQGTGNIGFTAHSGDRVTFCGQSVYANSEDAVIVYGVKRIDGPKVFNQFSADTITRQGAAFPDFESPTRDGLPAVLAPATFAALNSTIHGPGTETFYIHFALYTLDNKGENQTLFGYFDCDPTVTVP